MIIKFSVACHNLRWTFNNHLGYIIFYILLRFVEDFLVLIYTKRITMCPPGYRITIMALWQLLNLGTGCTVYNTKLYPL